MLCVHCPALGGGAESVFRVPVAFRMFGFPRQWWGAQIVFLFPQESQWAEGTDCRVTFQEPLPEVPC